MTLPSQHTFSAIVAGPSRAGKSVWIHKLIANADVMIDPKPERIVYCYSEWQDLFTTYNNVEFHHGIIDIEQLNKNVRNLVIVDDLVSALDQRMEDIFTKHSHHRNISIIFITQNLFQSNAHMRTMSRSASYIVVFKNARDVNQISYLARQMFPAKRGNFVTEAFMDATSVPFGYLFIDYRQETHEFLRIRTGIFPDEHTYIFTSKTDASSLQRYTPEREQAL